MKVTNTDQQRHRTSGQATVTAASAPITKIANTSGSGTTFTTTRVTDSSAWTLTGVTAGDTAVTSDGHRGLITSTGSNLVNVNAWLDASGNRKTPANASTVTIHRLSYVKKLHLKADADNGAPLFVSQHGTAVTTDYGLHEGEQVTLTPDDPLGWLDATKVEAISGGSLKLHWIQGGVQ